MPDTREKAKDTLLSAIDDFREKVDKMDDDGWKESYIGDLLDRVRHAWTLYSNCKRW